MTDTTATSASTSPVPPPESAGRDRAARAHRALWGLVLLASATAVVISAVSFARILGATPPQTWTDPLYDGARLLCTGAAGLWLAVILLKRPGTRRWVQVLACGLAAAALGVHLMPEELAWTVAGRDVATAVVLAWLAVAVTTRHGITPARLGLVMVKKRGWRENTRTTSYAAATIVAGAITGMLGAYLTLLVPQLALHHTGSVQEAQEAALGWSGPAKMAANVAVTSVVEDLIMVGALIRLGERACRPRAQIVVLAVVVEVAMHLYMGLPALYMLAWAGFALTVYRRTGQLLPLLCGHFAYDLGNSLGLLNQFHLMVVAIVCCATRLVTDSASTTTKDDHAQ